MNFLASIFRAWAKRQREEQVRQDRVLKAATRARDILAGPLNSGGSPLLALHDAHFLLDSALSKGAKS